MSEKNRLVIRRKPGEDMLVTELSGIGIKSGKILSGAGYPQVGHLVQEFRDKGKDRFIKWLKNIHIQPRYANLCADGIQKEYFCDSNGNNDSNSNLN